MIFETFLFSKMLRPIDDVLAASFADLSLDNIDYNRSPFPSRYRHFSAFEYRDGAYELNNDISGLFNSRRPFHMSYGARELQPIDGSLVSSRRIQQLLLEVGKCLPIEWKKYAVGVNQIRVKADDDHMGSPAPSLHQDGYEYSCHIAVHRENVSGGTSIISRSKSPTDVVLERNLQPGEFIFFNDSKLYHTATPVTCRIGGMPAWRDMLILDFLQHSPA